MVLALLAWVGVAAVAAEKENLVRNGDFSDGKGTQAEGWSKQDGITTFWETKGNPRGCLRFDTSVLQVDKKKFLENPDAVQGKSQGGQYDTVGAHEGVWAFCAPIEVRDGDQYFIVEADVKGPERSTPLFYPQVFIRGYQKFDSQRDAGTSSWFQTPHEGGPAYSEQFGKEQRPAVEGDCLMVYRHALVCRLTEAEKWEHFEMAFKMPKEKKYRPDVLLLKVYAMWPLGNYCFDNVKLTRASKEDYDAAKKKGHSIKGFMPTAEDAEPGAKPGGKPAAKEKRGKAKE
ncbi:MAG: hypothetical protein A3K18_35240 [Lentisphaerae bacterium RIFOXYA12_64_32]|nr:MAG: hypothetical protein A3K18_35240 [Lentisphaerae bacterium RIFOXYA12_64_32]